MIVIRHSPGNLDTCFLSKEIYTVRDNFYLSLILFWELKKGCVLKTVQNRSFLNGHPVKEPFSCDVINRIKVHSGRLESGLVSLDIAQDLAFEGI